MTEVARVDDRLGLAVLRASLSGRTLVTYARDHVAVRTPSRPDFLDGNALDLMAAPAPDALAGWQQRFTETVGRLGADRLHLRFEQPVADPSDTQAPSPDADLATALRAHGLELRPVTVLLLGALGPEPSSVAAELRPVEPPGVGPTAAVDRRWYASTVLYRYAAGDTPEDWRAPDEDFVAWSVDVQRELAAAGRAQVWIAMRHGAPVARLTLIHDRQGLAVLEDVVVHPVHRRRGLAAALTHRALDAHLRAWPGTRVGVAAEPGSAGDRLYQRLGFAPHATVWAALAPG